MFRRVGAYVGRHHWGVLATFIALGGTAYASGVLPPNSVGTAQIRNGAVTASKVAPPPAEIRARLNNDVPHGFGPSWYRYQSYGVAGYYRDDQGVVHISGVVVSDDNAPDGENAQNQCANGTPLLPNIFVLPVGYRPASHEIFSVDSGNAHGRVDVTPTGQVICVYGRGDQYVSLDGISFRARP